MNRRGIAAGAAIFLALLVIACGGSSAGATVVPATSGAAVATGSTQGGSAGPTQPAVADTEVPAAPSIAKVGDRTELDGTALTVMKIDRAAQLGQFQKAKEGNEFIIADVVVENTGGDKLPYNLLYFTVKDSDGFQYTPAIGADQPFASGELAKGEKARGNVAFEVKKAAKGLVLEYKPLTLGGGDAIKVALE